ncbi:MAG: superoxide dismutase [Alicyclobacillus macrosporangiidus]|uniref:superoxide dismutase n=1 Tax=Alicyclobacillus macrosporangiidus TaxID=392015 RepID=UPI0026E96289|nr:superoxide dismutase [Alicyclobacillus macrosporangiidus]MCL6600904.1 superoxide dismutase [Alicyclobacillus macrosporangiidus]
MYKQFKARPLPERLLKLNGISARTIREHYKLYEGYVNKANETRAKLEQIDLAQGNTTYSEIRALKRGESFALDGVKLHELYFDELGGKGKPSGEILKAITAQYGDYDRFFAEFRGAGLSARGWAILAFDTEQEELFIYITDDQHNGHVIQSIPILPMDVFEHAYYIDYGTSRGEYIDAFFRNLDWSVVNRRYVEARKSVRPRIRWFGSHDVSS